MTEYPTSCMNKPGYPKGTMCCPLGKYMYRLSKSDAYQLSKNQVCDIIVSSKQAACVRRNDKA